MYLNSVRIPLVQKNPLIETHNNEDEIWLPTPSRRSERGLDWFNFFLSDVLNGIDSFLATYLTGIGWGSQRIGFALSASSFTTMVS